MPKGLMINLFYKSMQIKSWQIADIGSVFAIITAIFMFYKELISYKGGGDSMPGLGIVLGIVFFLLAGVILILALFLKSEKYGRNIAKIGAILSILIGFGVMGIFFGEFFSGLMSDIEGLIIWLMFVLPGFLLVAAGIYYFWKKV